MAKYRVEDIRNVALVGHGAAGKTSVADALLYKAKAVDRRGSVDDGTSISDYDEEEKKRHFSIDTSLLHLEHQGKQIHLLDAPGYPDFVALRWNRSPRSKRRSSSFPRRTESRSTRAACLPKPAAEAWRG